MKVISTNIGKIQSYNWKNSVIESAINKKKVDCIQTSFEKVDLDFISNRKHHGGFNKALYSLDKSEYDYWKSEIEFKDWHYGVFGDNLTTDGLLDKEVRIGNIYQVGTAKVQAIQCRFPCIKLNVVFNKPLFLKAFIKRCKLGIYYRIIENGKIQKNDNFQLIQEGKYPITIQNLSDIRMGIEKSQELYQLTLTSSYLPESLIMKLKLLKR